MMLYNGLFSDDRCLGLLIGFFLFYGPVVLSIRVLVYFFFKLCCRNNADVFVPAADPAAEPAAEPAADPSVLIPEKVD